MTGKNVSFRSIDTVFSLTYVGLTHQAIINRSTFAMSIHDGITPGGHLHMLAENNLSELPDTLSARSNLGLGSISVLSDTLFLRAASNLADIDDAAEARVNLGVEDVQWAVAGGTADAITGTCVVPVLSLTDNLILSFRAVSDITVLTPTFKADGTTEHTITLSGGRALLGKCIKAGRVYHVRYNLANTRWELLNPNNPSMWSASTLGIVSGAATTIFAVPHASQIQYRLQVFAGWGTNHYISASITTDYAGGSPVIEAQATGGAGGTFSLSGDNLQLTQTTGATKDYYWNYIITNGSL